MNFSRQSMVLHCRMIQAGNIAWQNPCYAVNPLNSKTWQVLVDFIQRWYNTIGHVEHRENKSCGVAAGTASALRRQRRGSCRADASAAFHHQNHQAFTDSTRAATPAARPDSLQLPLPSVIALLPMDLRAQLMQTPSADAVLSIPVEKVLSQLASGSVKISFGELRAAVPGLFTSYGADNDARQIALPLNEIVSRISPTLLSRRAVKKVELAGDIAGPFSAPGAKRGFHTSPSPGQDRAGADAIFTRARRRRFQCRAANPRRRAGWPPGKPVGSPRPTSARALDRPNSAIAARQRRWPHTGQTSHFQCRRLAARCPPTPVSPASAVPPEPVRSRRLPMPARIPG